MPEPIQLSIVIPVLDEATTLEACLEALFAHAATRARTEVILCDGGSEDATLEIAARYPCRVVRGSAGRAAQMNAGSELANGEYLLFLHADSRLPAGFTAAGLRRARWGYFRLRLDAAAAVYRVIESAINLRTRLSRVAGGDQGLFFERAFFIELGGYPSIPLMEDVAICKLARAREKPAVLPLALTSSARRWRDQGVVSTVLMMWWLRFAYWLGVDPRRLHRVYYPERRESCND